MAQGVHGPLVAREAKEFLLLLPSSHRESLKESLEEKGSQPEKESPKMSLNRGRAKARGMRPVILHGSNPKNGMVNSTTCMCYSLRPAGTYSELYLNIHWRVFDL